MGEPFANQENTKFRKKENTKLNLQYLDMLVEDPEPGSQFFKLVLLVMKMMKFHWGNPHLKYMVLVF